MHQQRGTERERSDRRCQWNFTGRLGQILVALVVAPIHVLVRFLVLVLDRGIGRLGLIYRGIGRLGLILRSSRIRLGLLRRVLIGRRRRGRLLRIGFGIGRRAGRLSRLVLCERRQRREAQQNSA